MTVQFTVLGSPRTKKTSLRLVHIPKKGGGRGFTKILPSEAYEDWFNEALLQAAGIPREIANAGVSLPIAGPVALAAVFYRKQASGDLLGFLQSLADWLQEPRQKNGRTTRNGAGIIKDDVQVVNWDGSRLKKDALQPRIEVALTILADGQGDLF